MIMAVFSFQLQPEICKPKTNSRGRRLVSWSGSEKGHKGSQDAFAVPLLPTQRVGLPTYGPCTAHTVVLPRANFEIFQLLGNRDELQLYRSSSNTPLAESCFVGPAPPVPPCCKHVCPAVAARSLALSWICVQSIARGPRRINLNIVKEVLLPGSALFPAEPGTAPSRPKLVRNPRN